MHIRGTFRVCIAHRRDHSVLRLLIPRAALATTTTTTALPSAAALGHARAAGDAEPQDHVCVIRVDSADHLVASVGSNGFPRNVILDLRNTPPAVEFYRGSTSNYGDS